LSTSSTQGLARTLSVAKGVVDDRGKAPISGQLGGIFRPEPTVTTALFPTNAGRTRQSL